MTETPDNVTQLGLVPKPKVEDRIQQETITHLKTILDLANDGQVECLFIIVAHPDGTYSEAISSTTQFRQMVGQIEIVKQNWIEKYLRSLTGAPLPKGPST